MIKTNVKSSCIAINDHTGLISAIINVMYHDPKLQNEYDLEIIAGPCSITEDNVTEIIHEIAAIKTPQKKTCHLWNKGCWT
jgi:hypothetical protein